MNRRQLLLTVLTLLLCALALQAEPPDTTKADEDTLKGAGVKADPEALIEFFRNKTLDEVDREKITGLIRNLGEDAFEVREKASDDLVKIGGKAVSLLRQALRSRDVEVARRAEDCLKQIDKTSGTTITVAVARLLAVRKPAATAETLLKYLPYADEEYIVDSIRDTLTAVAVKDGKPDAVITDALQDKAPLRRGLAAEALVRAGQAQAVPAVRKLLEDADRPVRLRVGLAFVDMKDKTTIPGLIDLLADLSRDQSQPIEELLARIALEKSPNVPLGDNEATRKKCRDAWKEWWDKNGEGIDLTKIDLGERMLGYTLLAGIDVNSGAGRVYELDKAGKVRWQIDGLLLPMDAQVIGHDRVLITDYRARKVTERNFKGEVLWEKAVTGWPLCSQRLPSGNTMIFTRNQILEVDNAGKEVTTITRPGMDILSGQRLKDGNILIASRTGQIIQMDTTGKELKNIPAALSPVLGGNVELTPEGNYLVPNYPNNAINEIDPTGKVLKTFKATQPTSIARLSTGNVVAVSLYTQQMWELDREGKQLSEARTEGQIYRVRRR